MTSRRLTRLAALLLVVGSSAAAAARRPAVQPIVIGIIDFYGVDDVLSDAVRAAVRVRTGDTFEPPADGRPALLGEIERRLLALPGIGAASATLVCCEEGKAILYIGVARRALSRWPLHAAPAGSARLPREVVKEGEAFAAALEAAMRAGDAAEDDSAGHALNHAPAVRAIQERFVAIARRDAAILRRVLAESADASHRALAAQILGYVSNKAEVVAPLVDATHDPDSDVRNNALRTLALFGHAPAADGRPIQVPAAPFVGLLQSIEWSDRNKSSLALMQLSSERRPSLFAALRAEAMTPLVEMARWTAPGHAMPALVVLGRMAGLGDDDIFARAGDGRRESIIDAALRSGAGR